MRAGDLLEWLAGALAVAAAITASHRVWVGLAVAALVVAYRAQCLGTETVRLPQLSRKRKQPDAIVRRFPHQRGLRMITSREEARRP